MLHPLQHLHGRVHTHVHEGTARRKVALNIFIRGILGRIVEIVPTLRTPVGPRRGVKIEYPLSRPIILLPTSRSYINLLVLRIISRFIVLTLLNAARILHLPLRRVLTIVPTFIARLGTGTLPMSPLPLAVRRPRYLILTLTSLIRFPVRRLQILLPPTLRSRHPSDESL